LPRYWYRISRNGCLCEIAGCPRNRKGRGLLCRGREGRSPGKGQPVVLQAPETPAAQAPPCGDWPLCHGTGEPVVRVVEPCIARRDQPEPCKPAPAQHLPDQELAGSRGFSLPLVAEGRN